ncbi:Alpha/Beta hydrolase protein [Fennellomyces sp. T-0311]|nr:Alpha/Beta hydrolase protein [Fennellomyces sp. T-0311]
MSVEPFEIPSIPEERLADLKHKLRKAQYPNELEADVGWQYGAPRWAVEPLVQAWLNHYDWEKARAEMNKWHHYHVTIQGLKVHCVHEPSTKPNAIPLLLMNGWPSTFYEYHKVIAALRDGEGDAQAFHVVIPSLPGYGFSEPPKLPGHNIQKNGEIMDELMTTLGYSEYVIHGSDLGGAIAKWLVVNRKDHCKGHHTVFPMVIPPIPTPSNLFYHPFKVGKFLASMILGNNMVYGDNVKMMGRSFVDVDSNHELGYCAIQSTRPYTLAYGLSDSPVGLLSWILEKYHNWTFHAPGKKDTEALPESITTDEFLTQITIYWLTNSLSSSIRFYYEMFQEDMKEVAMAYIDVPFAVTSFPAELAKLPREWIEAGSKLVQYDEVSLGGHFPALEAAPVLVDYLQRFGKLLKTQKYID